MEVTIHMVRKQHKKYLDYRKPNWIRSQSVEWFNEWLEWCRLRSIYYRHKKMKHVFIPNSESRDLSETKEVRIFQSKLNQWS